MSFYAFYPSFGSRHESVRGRIRLDIILVALAALMWIPCAAAFSIPGRGFHKRGGLVRLLRSHRSLSFAGAAV
jgi:hypothetical protein